MATLQSLVGAYSWSNASWKAGIGGGGVGGNEDTKRR